MAAEEADSDLDDLYGEDQPADAWQQLTTAKSPTSISTLRILGRWMRMFTIPNQSSIPKAWTQFTTSDRLIPSSNRDRLVDLMEELVKVTCILQPHFVLLSDRYSEREEKREHGRLRTQAEIEVDAIKKHAMT
ncbi:FMN_red domain-containing protein [Rhodotorula toruloides]|nr:FMN_red domain-containing protein [Rhodotorula toruloides]